jgi:hypothetical protein
MRFRCPARQVVARRPLAFLVPSLVLFRPLSAAAADLAGAVFAGFPPAGVRCDEAQVS